MSTLARILARLRGPWVADDPAPEHSHPAACTYPTRGEVRAAVAGALHHPGTDTALVVPHVIDRVTRDVTALWDDDRPAGEIGHVDSFPHREVTR